MTQRRSSIPLLPYQKDFVLDVTTPNIGMVAGKGSGKTHCFAVKGIHMAQLNIGHTGILTEPTYSMVQDTLLPTLLGICDQYGIPYKYKQSPSPNLYLQFKTGISTILLRSAENHMRQRGITAAWAGIDEIDTMKKSVADEAFDTYTGRLRGGKVRQMFVTSTPEGFKFLHDYFVTNAGSDRRLIRAKTTENHHLAPDYIERMMKRYPANLIEAYINGEFVNLEGNTVYYNFDRKLNHTDYTLKDFPNHILHVGLDFNIGNTNAVVGIINKEQPYVLDELQVHDTDALIKEVKHRYPNRKVIIYPDSSGKNRSTNSSTTNIQMLKDAGFELCYRGQNPRVMDRVNSVNAMFENGAGERRLFVNTRICTDTTRCLEQQIMGVGNEPEKDAGSKKDGVDHKNDALGYWIYFRFPITGNGTLYSY